jgi:hypothetical protein
MYYKLALWAALSISGAVFAHFIFKFASMAKKRRDGRNFADTNYSIGAAVVNMERAVLYDDVENFKFFARYAIRLCLAMGKSYPPDEPPAGDVRKNAENMGVEPEMLEKILKLYSTESLPDDRNEWWRTLSDVRSVVAFFSQHKIRDSGTLPPNATTTTPSNATPPAPGPFNSQIWK